MWHWGVLELLHTKGENGDAVIQIQGGVSLAFQCESDSGVSWLPNTLPWDIEFESYYCILCLSFYTLFASYVCMITDLINWNGKWSFLIIDLLNIIYLLLPTCEVSARISAERC